MNGWMSYLFVLFHGTRINPCDGMIYCTFTYICILTRGGFKAHNPPTVVEMCFKSAARVLWKIILFPLFIQIAPIEPVYHQTVRRVKQQKVYFYIYIMWHWYRYLIRHISRIRSAVAW